jgi:hypothetical protein
MMMSLMRTTVRLAAVSLVAGSVLTGTPASAAVGDPGYQHVDVPFTSGGGYYAGSYISCPAGTTALAWGGTTGSTYGILTNGVTTYDGRGAYVTGSTTATGTVLASARCVADSRLAGSTLSTWGKYDHRTGYHDYVLSAMCPAGTVPYGGGGWLADRYGNPIAQGFSDYGSAPAVDGWTISRNGLMGENRLWVSTHCLPRAKLGNILTVQETVTGSPNYGLNDIVGGARCPVGYFAFAGGGWFHEIRSATPVFAGYMQINTMSGDDRGWFAKGLTFKANTQLTTMVRCTDRLG